MILTNHSMYKNELYSRYENNCLLQPSATDCNQSHEIQAAGLDFSICSASDILFAVFCVLQKKRKQASRDADSLSLCSLDINVSSAPLSKNISCVSCVVSFILEKGLIHQHQRKLTFLLVFTHTYLSHTSWWLWSWMDYKTIMHRHVKWYQHTKKQDNLRSRQQKLRHIGSSSGHSDPQKAITNYFRVITFRGVLIISTFWVHVWVALCWLWSSTQPL